MTDTARAECERRFGDIATIRRRCLNVSAAFWLRRWRLPLLGSSAAKEIGKYVFET